MEDLKNFTKRVFNKKEAPAKQQNSPQTPPGTAMKKQVPELAPQSSSDSKHGGHKNKKPRDFADSDDEDYNEEEDDDHLRDDIGATFSAAGGST